MTAICAVNAHSFGSRSVNVHTSNRPMIKFINFNSDPIPKIGDSVTPTKLMHNIIIIMVYQSYSILYINKRFFHLTN